jgi:hypothetical protein
MASAEPSPVVRYRVPGPLHESIRHARLTCSDRSSQKLSGGLDGLAPGCGYIGQVLPLFIRDDMIARAQMEIETSHRGLTLNRPILAIVSLPEIILRRMPQFVLVRVFAIELEQLLHDEFRSLPDAACQFNSVRLRRYPPCARPVHPSVWNARSSCRAPSGAPFQRPTQLRARPQSRKSKAKS